MIQDDQKNERGRSDASISGFSESESAFLKLVFNTIPQLVFARDVDGRLQFLNRSALAFLDLQEHQVHGKTFRELGIQVQNPEQYKVKEKMLAQGLIDEVSYLVHPATATLSNTTFELIQKRVSFDQRGEDIILGIASDVSQLHEAVTDLHVERVALQARNKFMSALNVIAKDMMQQMCIDKLTSHIAAEALVLAEAEYAFVSMVHESGEYMEMVGVAGRFEGMEGYRHNKGQGVAGTAWITGEVEFTNNYNDYGERLEDWSAIDQSCAIPFFIDDKVCGVVGVATSSDGQPIDQYLDLMTVFTQTVAIAIKNALLMQEHKLELARNAAVSKLTHIMYASDSANALVDNVGRRILKIFDAVRVIICKYTGEARLSQEANMYIENGKLKQSITANLSVLEDSVCQSAFDTRTTVFISRGDEQGGDSLKSGSLRKLYGIGSVVYVPLNVESRAWGVMMLGKAADQRDFNDLEISLIDVIGNQMSGALMRQNLLDEVNFQAFNDSLTKLPNRSAFEVVLKQIIAELAITGEMVALLFIDLDNFKAINDNQGHGTGDDLLVDVAARLTGNLQRTDFSARVGGDEFAVLLRDLPDKATAVQIAERLRIALDGEFTINGYQLKIGASIGVCFCPDDGDTVSALLKHADFAMYEAKTSGKNKVRSFDQELANQVQHRQCLIDDLQNAIHAGQLQLYYQPQVDVATRHVIGFEALLRWIHPEQGFIPPDVFIPVAEEAGFITEIGNWVLDEAVRQMAQWRTTLNWDKTIAVNISAPQFSLEDFNQTVFSILGKHSLDASALELEVTERIVMNNVKNVIEMLDELRGAGIKIAVDDFGTGYSSLRYLEDLPLDSLKIDKAFVDKLGVVNAENTLVYTIIMMARSFGLDTIAEGVETEEQVEILNTLGCDAIQGYFYSRPMPAADIPDMVSELETNSVANLKKAG